MCGKDEGRETKKAMQGPSIFWRPLATFVILRNYHGNCNGRGRLGESAYTLLSTVASQNYPVIAATTTPFTTYSPQVRGNSGVLKEILKTENARYSVSLTLPGMQETCFSFPRSSLVYEERSNGIVLVAGTQGRPPMGWRVPVLATNTTGRTPPEQTGAMPLHAEGSPAG